MLDRETATQIVVSVGAVGLFVALAAYVSGAYGTGENHLSAEGGFALVGGIAVFVLVVTVAGLWLARKEFEDLDEDGDVANDD